MFGLTVLVHDHFLSFYFLLPVSLKFSEALSFDFFQDGCPALE